MKEPPATYEVILVDDERDYRDWLRSLLAGSPEFSVIAEAGSGAEVLGLVDRLTPDVVISDVDMVDGDGLDLARHVAGHSPQVKVILVSGHDERGYARLARQEGAVAFIPKAKLTLEALREALSAEE